jgi:hypothetical protein
LMLIFSVNSCHCHQQDGKFIKKNV